MPTYTGSESLDTVTLATEQAPVVVIGHTGFIGAAIARTLTAGGVSVIAVSSKECNLVGSTAALELEALLPEKGRAVFCSAITRLVRDSYETMLSNIQMVNAFWTAARRRNLSHVIYLSTADVYGHRPPLPITETTLPSPETHYALSKLAGECLVRKIGRRDCPVTILRLPGIYGVGSDKHSAVGRLAHQICQDRSVTIFGDGQVRRDYVDVGDVCAVVEMLLQQPYDGILNLATGASISILELVHLIALHVRQNPVIRYAPPEPNRAGDQIFDTSALVGALPTLTLTPIEVGIARYLERAGLVPAGPLSKEENPSSEDYPRERLLSSAKCREGRRKRTTSKAGQQIVILGGSGFIGSALFRRFQQKGAGSVISYASSLDLTSPDCVEKLRHVVNPSTILIVAARASMAKGPLSAFSRDVTIATNIARCLSKSGVRQVVYFSTTAVYGDAASNISITEDTRVAPSTLYGTAKFAGECLLRQTTEREGIPLLILRPCMIYGPGDTSMAYGPSRFIHSILSEQRVLIFGDGLEGREYLFIRDLAEMVDRLVELGATGTINLGTGHMCTFQEIVRCLQAISPVSFQVVHVDRERPKADLQLKPVRLFKLLQEVRLTDFKEGLAETFKEFLARYTRSSTCR